MSQEQPNAHYEMYTLHSPPASPQQAQGQFQTMDYHQPQPQPQPQPDISSEQIVSQYAYYAPQGEISYTHQERHPALDFRTGYISPGLPPPGTEPPYTSQPNSPSFPPKPYQPKPDGNINGSTNPRMPPRIHTRIPYDAAKDIAALRTPIYTPGNIAGPNGGIHAPGQISHPNMRTGVTEKWANSAWACFGDWEVCKCYP
ncbi:hypothetical protein BDZ91DRAFT_234840 [Kalaharituber pfeilii]|nr:hypothetical protein BDZ91DRAFT_234840 [Kalaharituber pfeilii]